MKNSFVKFLETKGHTEKEFAELGEEAVAKLYNDYIEEARTKIESLSTDLENVTKEQKEALSELKTELLSAQVKALEPLTKASFEQGKAMAKLIKDGMAIIPESANDGINKMIADNIDEINKIQNAKTGTIEFKAVAPISTGSASLPVAAPALVGVQTAPPDSVNLRGVIVNELINTFPTTQAAYPYTETVPKDGDYTFLAEAGTKAQIDLKIETRWAEPLKIAAHTILSTESIQDIPNLQNIATNYLRAKHDLKRQNGILFGDGIAPNPKGATTYGRVFAAGSMANKVSTPNIMDIINACITDIYTTHNYTDEMPYLANLVMMNPVDFYLEFVSAKDANGLPLFPQATLFNRVQLGNTLVLPFEDIPANKLFVADMSKYNVSNYVDYTVTIGWINDQLITNQFTMVGESRLHAFVKKLDEQAFIYDDISVVLAAILKV